jgi:hypothetical protein
VRVPLAALVAVVFVSSCATAQVAPTSQPTPNINRSRLDIAYSAIASLDLHKASSRTLLMAALAAVRLQATLTGGTVDPATPAFTDASDAVPSDFSAFAQTVEGIALRNPQLSADLISDSAIDAMVKASPDCFTGYYKGNIGVIGRSAGLQSRLLSGSVGYVAWHLFPRNGPEDIVVQVRKALDALVAQGARAWLFDVRDNPGGEFSDEIADWFLNGEPTYTRISRVGAPTTTSARVERRLPAAYQLPIAIMINHASNGAAEGFAMALKENHRATIVGSTSAGCLGSENTTLLPGGGTLIVVTEEFVGPISGTHYANVGIAPDIASADDAALDVATKFLQSKTRP